MSREAELVEGGAAFDRRCDWFQVRAPLPSQELLGCTFQVLLRMYISGSPEDVHWHSRGCMVGSCKGFLSSRLIYCL